MCTAGVSVLCHTGGVVLHAVVPLADKATHVPPRNLTRLEQVSPRRIRAGHVEFHGLCSRPVHVQFNVHRVVVEASYVLMAPSGVFPRAAHGGSRATVPLISSQDSIRQGALSELWLSYAESTFAFAHSATFFEHGTAISHASLDEPTLAAAPYCATSSARLG